MREQLPPDLLERLTPTPDVEKGPRLVALVRELRHAACLERRADGGFDASPANPHFISCGDAPPWRVRPGRRAVGRNSRSPQVGPGTPC